MDMAHAGLAQIDWNTFWDGWVHSSPLVAHVALMHPASASDHGDTLKTMVRASRWASESIWWLLRSETTDYLFLIGAQKLQDHVI